MYSSIQHGKEAFKNDLAPFQLTESFESRKLNEKLQWRETKKATQRKNRRRLAPGLHLEKSWTDHAIAASGVNFTVGRVYSVFMSHPCRILCLMYIVCRWCVVYVKYVEYVASRHS